MAAQSIIRLPAVISQTGLCRSAIYQSIKVGAFPKPIPLGLRAVGWIKSEVDDWVTDRIKAARQEA